MDEDSSDNEFPMKLSALTKALLTQRPSSQSPPGSRDKSSESKNHSSPNVNTPAHGVRVVRIAAGSSGNRSRLGSSGPSSGRSNYDRSLMDKSGHELEQEQYDQPEEPATIARNPPSFNHGSISRYPATTTRARPEENPNPQSSMRIKRVGKGSFLSGPARRGRRRTSQEEGEDIGEEPAVSSQEHGSQPSEEPVASSYYGDGKHDFNSGSPASGGAAARALHRRQASNADLRQRSTRPSREPTPEVAAPAPAVQAVREPEPQYEKEIHYKLPSVAVRPVIPSRHDQENEAPSSYKRSKPSVDQILEKMPRRSLSANRHAQRGASPERKPLANMARNTPRRAAPPPPPKMSVLEAATTTAGAATTTQVKQRRNVLKVNGKAYTRLDCLGRGGSAKVYRVTAENGKMFALKRVALENADEGTIRGYKGEIDLLTKLSGVERVINLFDWEMNSEKQILSLLMEMGELDLNTLLKTRQHPEAATLNSVQVRSTWQEMLECLQSVHEYDIVHSDLKPANFVLVQGRLKLIDFGIANAIQTEETVNVHRETQVGTPNYMSPESLMDANNPRGGRIPGRPKLTKLGKPSDIWSLGCILYQMVYGLPPFGHIANQMARCQAIINWDHDIDFPSRGMGGVPVPPSLLRTMRRCLHRDQYMRPTCEELLHPTDPFLYPVEMSEKALPIDEEMLGRVIQSVVARCRDRIPTEAEILSVWPKAYWASVKKQISQ